MTFTDLMWESARVVHTGLHTIVRQTNPLQLAILQAGAAVDASALRVKRQQSCVLALEILDSVEEAERARELLALMQRNHTRRKENLKRLRDAGLVVAMQH